MMDVLFSPSNNLRQAVLRFFLLSIALGLAVPASAQDPDHRDVVYATVGDQDLMLDIYMPTDVESPPLVVYVHGGAWRTLTKMSGVPVHLLDHGFAVASLEFRMSTVAPFPAMVHDIKGAIRLLRNRAGGYGFNAERIAVTGLSSGGHLAALVGVTNGHSELEGSIGGNEQESSDVQAIISYFGASDLTTILDQSTPHGLSVRVPALKLLLGAAPDENPEIARLASPVYHVDANDPPLLLFHGDRDPQMPINQSLQLEGAYLKQGLDVTFDAVHGAGHGGRAFYDQDHLPPAVEFLNRTIKDTSKQ